MEWTRMECERQDQRRIGKAETHNLLKRIKSGATNSILLEKGYAQDDIDKARKLCEG